MSKNIEFEHMDHKIEIFNAGGGIAITTPDGRRISCHKKGTHVALRQVHPYVRYFAEIVAGWR